MDSGFWERGLMFAGWGAAALLGVAALVGAFGGFTHGNHPATSAVRAPAVRTSSSRVEGLAQAPPTRVKPTRAQPTPAVTATVEAGASLDRCDVLRTNPNWSAGDREWFLSRCLGTRGGTTAPDPQAGGGDELPAGSADVQDSPPEEPQATPPPAPPLRDSDVALALAVQWLQTGAPVMYRVDTASCTSSPAGDAWLVTCRATLAGCSESGACARSVSMCVHQNPPSVTPLREC